MKSVYYHALRTVSESCYVIFGVWKFNLTTGRIKACIQCLDRDEVMEQNRCKDYVPIHSESTVNAFHLHMIHHWSEKISVA